METMIIFICITGGTGLLCVLLGWGLGMAELIYAAYVSASLCALLLAIVPLFVWAAVRRLSAQVEAQRRR